MNELQQVPVLSSLYLGLFIAMTLSCLVWYLYEIGKKNAKKAREEENQFGDIYFPLQNNITKWEVSEKSYYVILKQIAVLRKMKYKNPEFMNVLENNFYKKYKVISDEILSRDEFSVEQVLK